MSDIVIRIKENGDHAYICDSTLCTMRHAPGFSHLSSSMFFDENRSKVTDMIRNSEARVACYVDDPTLIFGFISYNMLDGAAIVRSAIVKERYRKVGIFSALILSLIQSESPEKFFAAVPNTISAKRFMSKSTHGIFAPVYYKCEAGNGNT